MLLTPTLRAAMSNEALRKEYEELLGEARTAPRSAPPEATEEEIIRIMAIASAARWLEAVSGYLDEPLRSRPVLGTVQPTPPDPASF